MFLSATNTSREGIAALSKLQSLQEFYFFKSQKLSDNRRTQLMKLCFELLPQLHIVGLNPEPQLFCKNIMGIFTSKALAGLSTQQCTLQLRRLVLTDRVRVPEHVALPTLQFLCLNWPSEPASLDPDRFPQLSELALFGVCRDELMRILRQVGRQLNVLHFEVHDMIELNRVLEKCPNLSELSLHVFGVYSTRFVLQPTTLRRLQKLRITFADLEYDHQPMLIVHLLQNAPELRSVSLSLQSIPVNVFEEMFLLAKQHTCMRHLEELKVYIDNENCDRYERALIGIVLLFCTFECHQLTNVKLVFKSSSK